MGYSSAASKLRAIISEFNAKRSAITGINFDSVWKGKAHDTQIGKLDSVLTDYGTEVTNIEKFAKMLDMIQQYKDKMEEIERLTSQLNSLPDDEEYAAERASLNKKIATLKMEASNLKLEIAMMNSFSTVASKEEKINYDYDVSTYKDFTYLYDYKKLRQLNMSGRLSLFNWFQKKETLYDYYDKAYVESVLDDIKSMFDGREAAVNCTLAMMQMAADVGKKLTYAGSQDIFDIGVKSDCSVFASWGVNQGTQYGDFDKKNVLNLYRSGVEYDTYEEALPGDVLIHFGADRGSYHATFLLENDTENKVVTIAEAGGKKIGVRVREMSYAELKDRSYRAVNMSQYYDY